MTRGGGFRSGSVLYQLSEKAPNDPRTCGHQTVSIDGVRAYRRLDMSARRRTTVVVALALGGLSLGALVRPDPGVPVRSPPRSIRASDLVVLAARANLLSWSGSSPSYRIERAPHPAGPWSGIGTTSSTAFRDRPPTPGIYWYRVRPLAAGGAMGRPTVPVSNDDVRIAARIGPAGGVLRASTGTVALRIPPGAVRHPSTFSITQLEAPPAQATGGVLVTRAFDIGPSGTRFDPPAILTLRADAPAGAALPEDADVNARWWDATAGRWDPLAGARFDPERSVVTAEIPHLSMWAAAVTTVPHGGYGSDTDYCGACHQSHGAATEPRLLVQPTERETCYACHDPSGTTDVRDEFGEVVIGTSTRTSVHPVPAPADGVQLTCSDCHTPHKPIAEDTMLLRVREADGTYRYSPPDAPIGDDFCYACHGASSTLPAPVGDHSAFEASVHGTNDQVPLPPSGSGIRCLACHEPHGSDNPRLTTADQESMCYACHTAADPPPPLGTTVAGAFAAKDNDYSTTDGNPIRVYHHPIAAVEQAGGTRVVECSSCHNVHVAAASDSATGSQIVDPNDTASPWIVTWNAAAATKTKGDIAGFCLRCHVDPTTTQPLTPGPNVPYTVRMVEDTALDADGTPHDTFSATDWVNVSPHGPGRADLACTACHDPHGSSNAYLLREAMVSPDGTSSATITGFNGLEGDAGTLTAFCETCHAAASLPADADHSGTTLCTECHSHGSGRF
jgi:predicted CXXCH cytochrome family protein